MDKQFKDKTRKPKIIAVDDEPDVVTFFKNYFNKYGYEVTTAADGLETLEKIKKNDYDMLITDMRRPGIDGMQLLKEVNKLNKDLIKIVISGVNDIGVIKEAIKLGCFAYITKPVILEHVKNIIEKAFTTQAMPGIILLAIDPKI